MKEGIHTKDLIIGYQRSGKPPLTLSDSLELGARKGELVALVGPNGCGKSTLLRTLAGLHAPIEGEVLIEGNAVQTLSPRKKARLLSVVLTSTATPGNMKVEELVALGRSPYRSALSPMTEEDRAITKRAMEQSKVESFAGRSLDTLSDGETQRVMIARALAQRTPVILLDEPTAHLDLLNRVEILRMLRELAKEEGITVILSSHDLDLVLRMADRVWLMSEKGRIHEGIPEELALNGRFGEVFSNEKVRFDRRSGDFRPLDEPLGTLILEGSGPSAFWAQRVLERFGYEVRRKVSENETPHIVADENAWYFNGSTFSNLEDLVRSLR